MTQPNLLGGWPPSTSRFPEPSSVALRNTLPLLPGYNFERLKSRTTFKKHHCFEYIAEIPRALDPILVANEVPPGLQKVNAVVIQQAHPSWVSLDKKVLRFYAYYKEGIHESRNETVRVRRCIIYFFLEDDTILVWEPREGNSGLEQGKILRRQRVARNANPEDYYTLDDFDVGTDIHIYGRVLHIVDCDDFTRDFYAKLGRSIKPSETLPEDTFVTTLGSTKKSDTNSVKPVDDDLAELRRYQELKAGGKLNLLSQAQREAARDFLDYDRMVLRFNALWDDRRNIHGDYRIFTLLFFLSDQTLKVIEVYPNNGGRDPFPVFIKRMKVPKTRTPHADCSLETMTYKSQEYVTELDLSIGNVVDLMGRNMLIYNCDEFTRVYYQQKYNLRTDEMSPMDVALPKKVFPRSDPPPHRGFGSEEDSLSNWGSLVPRPPKFDVKRAQQFEGKVLRFAGYLNCQPLRRILLVVYLKNNFIGVFEQNSRNTGFTGGKFLQPQKVKKPIPGNATLRMTAPYYEPQDFYVGATVNINGHVITLDQTDDQTIRIVEGAQKEFSTTDVRTALTKFREMILTHFARITDAFRTVDEAHDGVIGIDELLKLCQDAQIALSDAEVTALMRHFDVNGDGVIDFNEFVERLQPPAYQSELEVPPEKIMVAPELLTKSGNIQKTLQLTQRVNEITSAAEDTRVFTLFREKLSAQRSVFLDTFRLLSARAPDGRLGVREFLCAITETLFLEISDAQKALLVRRFFGADLSTRLTVGQFAKVMDNVSNFTRKKI